MIPGRSRRWSGRARGGRASRRGGRRPAGRSRSSQRSRPWWSSRSSNHRSSIARPIGLRRSRLRVVRSSDSQRTKVRMSVRSAGRRYTSRPRCMGTGASVSCADISRSLSPRQVASAATIAGPAAATRADCVRLDAELVRPERLEHEQRRRERVVDEGQRPTGARPGDVGEAALLLERPAGLRRLGHGAAAREAAGVHADDRPRGRTRGPSSRGPSRGVSGASSRHSSASAARRSATRGAEIGERRERHGPRDEGAGDIGGLRASGSTRLRIVGLDSPEERPPTPGAPPPVAARSGSVRSVAPPRRARGRRAATPTRSSAAGGRNGRRRSRQTAIAGSGSRFRPGEDRPRRVVVGPGRRRPVRSGPSRPSRSRGEDDRALRRPARARIVFANRSRLWSTRRTARADDGRRAAVVHDEVGPAQARQARRRATGLAERPPAASRRWIDRRRRRRRRGSPGAASSSASRSWARSRSWASSTRRCPHRVRHRPRTAGDDSSERQRPATRSSKSSPPVAATRPLVVDERPRGRAGLPRRPQPRSAVTPRSSFRREIAVSSAPPAGRPGRRRHLPQDRHPVDERFARPRPSRGGSRGPSAWNVRTRTAPASTPSGSSADASRSLQLLRGAGVERDRGDPRGLRRAGGDQPGDASDERRRLAAAGRARRRAGDRAARSPLARWSRASLGEAVRDRRVEAPSGDDGGRRSTPAHLDLTPGSPAQRHGSVHPRTGRTWRPGMPAEVR